jgi:hypothetical protein
MGFWDRLLKAEQNIRRRVESAFGHGSAQTPLEIRREIIEQVESRIVVDTGGSRFPFAKVAVLLQPPTEALRDVFEAAFLQDGSLRTDILETLRDSQARYPSDLEVAVELRLPPSPATVEDSPLFQLDFVKPDPSRRAEVPEAKLVILKGSAEQPEYRLKKERILVGRLAEVLDREGRLVRKNDVVFLDNEEDINSTVGRIHARIWFDLERGEFCILDEASRYGTRVIREGRSIEVPGGNSRGIRLRSGDEIYFGQACLRFELISLETGSAPA